MTLSEIEEEVLRTWQVSEASIYAAILGDARFGELDDGRIGLTRKGLSVKKIRKRSDGSRHERLVRTFRDLTVPVHYQDLTRRHNELFPENPLTPQKVYQTLRD